MLQGSTDSSDGLLDVSVKYEAVQFSGGKSNRDSQHVNITVSILIAAGLKVYYIVAVLVRVLYMVWIYYSNLMLLLALLYLGCSWSGCP